MLPLDRLTSIYWEERWLEFEAHGAVNLPPYAGSTIRGALGTVMRPALCARQGACGQECSHPASCPFYSLFEQSRAANGQGSNIPKPLIIESPLSQGLREIAIGGTVEPPFSLQPCHPIPILSNPARVPLRPGERILVGLRGLGAAGAALDGVLEGVSQKGLEVNGGRLELVSIAGGSATLADQLDSLAPCGHARLRLALVTPALIKVGSEVCFDPPVLGRLLLDQAVIRAVSLYNAFFARTGRERIPFIEPQWPRVALTSHRLFQYRIPRQSYRQGRWMDFDGVVGWMEWEGDVNSILPWLRAAEILHVGQKATFGLGRVELLAPLTSSANSLLPS